MPSVLRAGSVALLLGALVGFVAQVSDSLVPELSKATSLGVPWLVAAFALARRRTLVVALGLTAMVAGAVFLGEHELREALRGTGWNGA
ncbi:MAG: hypothetical protein ACRDKY_02770 [Solirubrobacteraceae bacterium]